MAMARTLIVEDSNFFRQLLRESLLSRFPEMIISEAANAQDALETIETFTPDLIFIDIRLPGESGLELTRKLKNQYPDIPVIILTSYDLPEYREAAKGYKADHFLSKSAATKEIILALVNSILSKRNIDLDNSPFGER